MFCRVLLCFVVGIWGILVGILGDFDVMWRGGRSALLLKEKKIKTFFPLELETKNSKKYEQMFAQTNVLHFSPQLSIPLHKQHNTTKSLSQNNKKFCY